MTRDHNSRIFSPRRHTMASAEQPIPLETSFSGSAPQRKVTFFDSFCLGTVAAIVAATAVFPMDKIKTRLQSNGGTIWSNARNIVANEGTWRLYRGLSPQLAMIGPVNAGQMATNDFVQGLFRGKDSSRELQLWELTAAGGAAGIAEILLSNPQEVVKIRMQMQGNEVPLKSPIALIREIGLRGLYKGVGVCTVRDIPFSVVFFVTYDWLKNKIAQQNAKQVTSANLLISGTVAAALGAVISTPADVIKTKLQNGTHEFKSYSDCIRHIKAEAGIPAFFRGTLSRIFIIAPMFGIQFMIFENLKNYFFKSK